jgi:diguanylate cyclase (GGDEF)-like protein
MLGVWLLLLLLLLLLLSPCTVLAQAATPDLDLHIRALEDKGRAHPQETADALERLLPSTAEFSPQRLELLTVQGLILAVSTLSNTAERPAAALEAWGRTPGVSTAHSATAAAMLIRVRVMARAGDLKRADALMNEAMALLPESMAARDRWRFVYIRAYLKDLMGPIEEAVRLHHEALALAEQSQDIWRQVVTRRMLAYSYFSAKLLDQALVMCKEALMLAEKTQDWIGLGHVYTTNSLILDAMGDRAGFRRSLELGIVATRRAGSKIDEVRYLVNISDSYLKTAEYKTALSYAEQALPLTRELKEARGEAVALANIGMAHIGLRHLELGKRYVHEALVVYERLTSATKVAGLWQALGAALENVGDLVGAAQAYHQHRKLAANILRKDQESAILTIQEQYDADQRQRVLELLNRENQIKAEQIRSDALHLRLWGLLVVAFCLFFAVVALLYRRLRRINRLLSGNNAQLKIQGERDPLTGLANRRHFQAVVRQWASDGKLDGAAYLIDIDHFKLINDRYGHSAGDAVLVEVARRLRETLREQDLIVRWGGEEFLVLVRTALADHVDALAQRLISALEEVPVSVDQTRIPITGSIGYASFPIGPNRLGVHWERAVELVDAAMYLAKAQGRNRAYGVRFPQACDAAAVQAISQSLEAAWRDGRVVLTQLLGRRPLAQAS